MQERNFFNLDEYGREVNDEGPLSLHVPFGSQRQLTVFDRLRLKQLELLGGFQNDYDSDGSFLDSDESDDDFFDAPTSSQLLDEAIELRSAAQRQAAPQKIASKSEQGSPARTTEEPPLEAAE